MLKQTLGIRGHRGLILNTRESKLRSFTLAHGHTKAEHLDDLLSCSTTYSLPSNVPHSLNSNISHIESWKIVPLGTNGPIEQTRDHSGLSCSKGVESPASRWRKAQAQVWGTPPASASVERQSAPRLECATRSQAPEPGASDFALC